MEKKNEPNCERNEQKFEKKTGTMVGETEKNYSSEHEKRGTEAKDNFERTEHGKEHETSSIGNTAGNHSQKPESWEKNKEQGACSSDARGKDENCAGKENYRKEHNAFGEKDPHTHVSDDLHNKEHRD